MSKLTEFVLSVAWIANCALWFYVGRIANAALIEGFRRALRDYVDVVTLRWWRLLR